jgi:hypothetical protein
MKRNAIISIILVLFIFSCNTRISDKRDYLYLEGSWQFALDTNGAGVTDKWYLSDLNDSITLPGTTDLNHKGHRNTDSTTLHLSRIFQYEGAAWYRKRVIIPAGFKNRHIILFLERTKPTQIWIDSLFAGSSRILQTPQQFDLTRFLSPGEHFITIRVDNSLKLTPYGNIHIYSDDTQTNWNGIIGRIYLEASAPVYISDLQVFPDIDNRKIDIRLNISDDQNVKDIGIKIQVEKLINGKSVWLRPKFVKTSFKPVNNLSYTLGNNCSLWDEYHQPTYRLWIGINTGSNHDTRMVPFGMRRFAVKGTQFEVNGRKVFLRGKHEAAVFPLTGFTPTDTESWIRVLRIAKDYGINHYRFHSYCPPEAAFTAADQEGIYLQVELPFWGVLKSDTLADMLKEEGLSMLKSYANHPSFVMFSHGNEIGGDQNLVERNIIDFKKYDSRPLYTTGSNNGIGYIAPPGCSDYFVGARTPYVHDTTLTHTRLTQAFVDSRDAGILNTQVPSADVNFSYAVSHMKIPVVSHEIGQYQTYPDYSEIKKYKGVLEPRNLEIFRSRLAKAGMLQMDSIFHVATGIWAAKCYKAEMEAALRTDGMAGFQLLDLQDYPGQGTALVGILDAFMESKKIISPNEWKQSCNDVVILLEFPKYCWTAAENFHANVIISNYSGTEINKTLEWTIHDRNGKKIASGAFPDLKIGFNGNTAAGEIKIPLSGIAGAEKLVIRAGLKNTQYENEYTVWVYPPVRKIQIPEDITVCEKLGAKELAGLMNGEKVLLFPRPEDIRNKSVGGLFIPEFWNYGMFKGISEWMKKPVSPGTLGILTNPDHPIFNSFPTGFHTDWQWFSIIKAGNPLILDNAPAGYKPIVQVIDNLERNHKLGLIFECRAGKGRLLVCMSQLNKLTDRPEAVQLYESIIRYIESDKFDPAVVLNKNEINVLLGQ